MVKSKMSGGMIGQEGKGGKLPTKAPKGGKAPKAGAKMPKKGCK